MADKTKTPLEQVIQTAIDSALKEVHTCLPAVVTKVNHTDQLIDAQITLKRKLSGKLVNLPLLVNVPLRYWRSKTFSITFPIEIGDHVKIVFSERSIDTWLTAGGIQNPFDFRKFSLSDAFAEPAMYPQTDVIPNFDPANLELKTNSGDTKIIVKASEDVEVITTGEIKADCDTLVADVTTKTDLTCPVNNIIGNVFITGSITWSGTAQGVGGAPAAFAGGVVNAGGDIISDGKSLETHTHPQANDSDGDTQQNTGVPI